MGGAGDDGDQHGALVKKMIDSKKQLENGSEIAGQRADVVRTRYDGMGETSV